MKSTVDLGLFYLALRLALIACLLALAGCGAAPDCYTPAGVPVLGSCDEAAEWEGKALQALASVPEFQGRELSKALRSVGQIEIDPTDRRTARGKMIYGTTWCMVPGSAAFITLKSWRSLVHEYAHVIVGCGREPDHPLWSDRQIEAAIIAAGGRPLGWSDQESDTNWP